MLWLKSRMIKHASKLTCMHAVAEKSYNQTCSKAGVQAGCCVEVMQSSMQLSWRARLLMLRSHTIKPAAKLACMLSLAEKSYNQTCSKADIHACCCCEVIKATLQQRWRACLLLLTSLTIKPAAKLTCMLAVAEKSYYEPAAKLTCILAVAEKSYNPACSKAGVHACCW